MSEWENAIGESDEWHTPKSLADKLPEFDLDVSAPPEHERDHYFIRARDHIALPDDGLREPWHGLVWMNPPFGDRLGHLDWLRKFIAHGNGIGLLRAYTSAAWFTDSATEFGWVLFPRGKTKFVRPNGDVGDSPGGGVFLFALGDGVELLQGSGIIGVGCRFESTEPRRGELF